METGIVLQERWDVQVDVEKNVNNRFVAIIKLIIKNKSPYDKEFEYYLKSVSLKDQLNLLKLYLYTGLGSKNYVKVPKYSKEIVYIPIPKLPVPDDLKMVIGVKKLDTDEEKELEIEVPI